MLDILIPSNFPNLKIIEGCIDAATVTKRTVSVGEHEFTDTFNKVGVPYRVIVSVDGTTRQDRSKIESYLLSRAPQKTLNPIGVPGAHQITKEGPRDPLDWRILDWPKPTTWHQNILQALRYLSSEFLMILPPWVHFDDGKWFGKLQQVFAYDRQAMLAALPDAKAPKGTLPPARFIPRKHPTSDAILTRRKVANDIIPRMRESKSVQEWVRQFSVIAEQRGGNRWLAPAVRYLSLEHDGHFACREKLEDDEKKKDQFGSRSQMIPESSIPTTSDLDGSPGFVPF